MNKWPLPYHLKGLPAWIQSAIQFLSGPHIVFYTLPWMMVLLILGTITQKHIGLYGALHTYFNTWFFWLWGIFPLPGGITTIGIITLALLTKFIFCSVWNWQKSGTILSHFGVLLLLLGGMISAITSQEYFMIIQEGQKTNILSDYFKREISLTTENGQSHTIPFQSIKNGDSIALRTFGIESHITFDILLKCENCTAQAPSGTYENLQGLAQNMELQRIENEKQPEANFSGLVIAVKDAPNNENGTYIIMEDVDKNPVLSLSAKKEKNNKIEIKLDRKKTTLPYAIELRDFEKINYAGTNKAQEYKSSILIHDGTLSWPSIIKMNTPLRYKGYSFYQSSFVDSPNHEATVLNVVYNQGRLFPYIASLIIFLGLATHLVIRVCNKIGHP